MMKKISKKQFSELVGFLLALLHFLLQLAAAYNPDSGCELIVIIFPEFVQLIIRSLDLHQHFHQQKERH